MAFDYAGAQAAGYSDEEIQRYLSSKAGKTGVDKVLSFLGLGKVKGNINLITGAPRLGAQANVAATEVDRLAKQSRDLILQARGESDPNRRKELLDQSRAIDARIGQVGGELGIAEKGLMERGEVSEKDLSRSNLGFALRRGGAQTAQLGSYAVPFGRGTSVATRALLPGAVVGALQSASDETSAGNIARGAVAGAAGAGILYGAGKTVGAITKGITKKLPEKMMEGVFKEPLRQTRAATKKGATLGQEALKRGVKGKSDEVIYLNAIDKIGKYEDALQQRLSKSTRIIPIGEIKESVAPLIKKYAASGNTSAVNNITSRIEALEKYHGKSIPISVANEVKRSLYDEARKSYGQMGSENIEGVKAIAKALKDGIANRVLGATEINRGLGVYGRIADSLVDKMSREGRRNLIGLGDMLTGGFGVTVFGLPGIAIAAGKKSIETTAAQTYGANILQKLGILIDKLPKQENKVIQTILGQTGARAGAGTAKLFAGPKIYSDQADQGAQQKHIYPDQGTPPSVYPTTSAGQKQITQDQLMQILLHPKISDKTKQNVQKIYDYQLKAEKPLGAEQQKVKANAESGLRALQTVRDEITSNPYAILLATLPGAPGARTYDTATREMVDVLARLRTGAVITESEEKFYRKQIPSILDSSATVQYKLRLFENFFTTLANQQPTGTELYTPTTP